MCAEVKGTTGPMGPLLGPARASSTTCVCRDAIVPATRPRRVRAIPAQHLLLGDTHHGLEGDEDFAGHPG